MSGERVPLVGTPNSSTDNSFYTGDEKSTGDVGSSGVSKKILPAMTIISVLVAIGCSIYGYFVAEKPMILLPLIVVLIWLFIHILVLLFARSESHEFNPPGWFIFVSSGNIFIQALIVIILTPFKKPT